MFDHKLKASASEKLVEVDLLYKGYEVFTPSAYGGDYDLIVDVENKLYKVQVKTGTIVDDNKIRVDVRKSSNAKDRIYSRFAYDVLAIAHPEKRIVAYIHRHDMTATNSLNMWLIPRELIPSKGLHLSYAPLIFDDLGTFPKR